MNQNPSIISTCSFATDRLKVGSWHASLSTDAARAMLIAELSPVLDRAVTRHLPPQLQPKDIPGSLESWVAERGRESEVFCVRDRHSNTLLGLLILAAGPELDKGLAIRLGYLLSQNNWGRGIATELVTGFVSWAHGLKTCLDLIGGVDADNPASGSVLSKAGFERRTDLNSEATSLVYVLEIRPGP